MKAGTGKRVTPKANVVKTLGVTPGELRRRPERRAYA